MDNQNNRINPFVNNEGFSAENNLADILGNNDDNEGDQVISQVKLSTYLDTHELSDKLYQAKSKLSILSLNAQSIIAIIIIIIIIIIIKAIIAAMTTVDMVIKKTILP